MGWKYGEPHLEAIGPTPPPTGTDDDRVDVADVTLAHRIRLAPATFEDVQRTIRCWVDAVERYPVSFRLHEDRLSDLLAATLNAALPGASREVYSRGGKSDIFIRADVLAEGTGPAKIFICESKWWHGPAKSSDAFDQLLRYLEAKDTAAVLIFFIDLENPIPVRRAAEAALASRAGFQSVSPGAVDAWPVLTFSVGGRELRLCLAFVDLPPIHDPL